MTDHCISLVRPIAALHSMHWATNAGWPLAYLKAALCVRKPFSMLQVEQQAAAEAAVLAVQASEDAAGGQSGGVDGDDIDHHSAPKHRSILSVSANGGCAVQPLNESCREGLPQTKLFRESQTLSPIFATNGLLSASLQRMSAPALTKPHRTEHNSRRDASNSDKACNLSSQP